jgi:hypothetical protein
MWQVLRGIVFVIKAWVIAATISQARKGQKQDRMG